MLGREKISDVMRWYSLMKFIEKKYGIVKVLAPAVGFLALVRPEYIRLISSESELQASFELSEQVVRLELAKKVLTDNNYIGIPRDEFETLMDTCSNEQRLIIEENILPFEKFRRCGFDTSEKSFIDYLARSNGRGSVKHSSTSHRHLAMNEEGSPKESYVVAMDERTLMAYVFPQSQRNSRQAFNSLAFLGSCSIPVSYRSIFRLGELFAIDSEVEWQTLLRVLSKEGFSLKDDREVPPSLLAEAITQARNQQQLLSDMNKSASQVIEEQSKAEAERQRELDRQREEAARLEEERLRVARQQEEEAERVRKEAEEAKRLEQERVHREETKRKLEEESLAAKKREAEKKERQRITKLKEGLLEK